MPTISTQKEFRDRQSLSFCYLCGQKLKQEDSTRDHVLAKAMFKIEDREPALILPTHGRCNTKKSQGDEKLAQVLWAGRGHYPSAKNQKVRPVRYDCENLSRPLFGIPDTDMKETVWRWVQGFYAALYQEHLRYESDNKALHLPFPGARLEGHVLVGEPILQQQYGIADWIKRNRETGSVDSLVANNGKTRFECVWIQSHQGPWACVFALTVDNWESLALRRDVGPYRGCVGFYGLDRKPLEASSETLLVIDIQNRDPLDPFGP